MFNLSVNARGIALMVLATGTFLINDTFMKLAMVEIPPFQALFLRGIFAILWAVPLLLVTGTIGRWHLMTNRWALLRNFFEILTVFCILNALARMPIGDVTAISLLAPMILLCGAVFIYKEKIVGLQVVLIAVGFLGAMLVVQPTGEAFSPVALLALGAAFAIAGRDLAARGVPRFIPAPVVTAGAAVLVTTASGLASLLVETWVAPAGSNLVLLAAAALFLTCGQLSIFLAFRIAPVSVVAPFLYMTIIWAVLSGLVVFGDFPNAIALIGIALIVVSGVLVVMITHRRRPAPMGE